jgi:hypothetical protein
MEIADFNNYFDKEEIKNVANGRCNSKHPKVVIPFKGRYIKINTPNSERRLKNVMSRKKARLYCLADKVVDRLEKPHSYYSSHNLYLWGYDKVINSFIEECLNTIRKEDLIINLDHSKTETAFLKIVKAKCKQRGVGFDV